MPETSSQNPTLARMDDQIEWYDGRSRQNRAWYKTLKGVTIIAALLIAPLANAPFGKEIAMGLGLAIAIAEGLQQLNRYHENWLSYRSSAEALKREKYLFLGMAAHYSSAEKPLSLLAERVENITSVESTKWLSSQAQEKAGSAAS